MEFPPPDAVRHLKRAPHLLAAEITLIAAYASWTVALHHRQFLRYPAGVLVHGHRKRVSLLISVVICPSPFRYQPTHLNEEFRHRLKSQSPREPLRTMACIFAAACFFICLLVLEHGFGSRSVGALSTESPQCIPDLTAFYIGDRASCTFTESVDFDRNRFPHKIPIVSCKCPGQVCSPEGDFRCHEVKKSLYVLRLGRNGTIRREEMKFTVSCVCALLRIKASDLGGRFFERPSRNISRFHASDLDGP
uniref:Uncharacterized protein n=1 Tax=Amblyomma maculatum TaxID=34609 RepID=G3MSH5_AMBMU